MNGRERFFAHLRGEAVDHLPCLPITMQFAADLIGVPYKEYATDYRALVRGQIAVAETFGLDYVNTMSDPACEAADCGAKITFHPDQPPAVNESESLLMDKETLVHLKQPDPSSTERMSNRLKALSFYKEQVGGQLMIEGWIEGPLAEAADLRGINRVMLDFLDDPSFVRDLFEFVLEMELRFAKAQVDSGAEQIGIGDAAASLVGPKIYKEFVWPYQKRMVDALHEMGVSVRLHICGNTSKILEGMGKLGCDIVELDSLVSMADARETMGAEQILLGNIDPVRVVRNTNPDTVREALEESHREAGHRYMVGAGCEVPRDTPKENMQAIVDYARQHSPDRWEESR
ncbi:MAG: uroporphyrinogen decarboxylase family protein [Armatimonadetes bacterium]|nr:uroporphyrinogen decarboxylase family protein [Armatimonadota bacterium]